MNKSQVSISKRGRVPYQDKPGIMKEVTDEINYRPLPKDPVALQIEQEVEEFLRDLTLEFSFTNIFETLRRYEFKDRFGTKILPMRNRKSSEAHLKEIRDRIDQFLDRLLKTFGSRYKQKIEDSFRYYTQTTFDEENSPQT